MKIYSPLAHLIEVLQQVNQTAIKHAARLKNNEAATRAALVDPILRAAGWDMANPELVEMEKLYIDTRLDYGLLDYTGKVQVIVEAKSLGVYLYDPKITSKLFSYGFTYGIQNIILTDGIIWQHYLQVAPGNMTPDGIDISVDPLVACADFFISKMDAARFWSTEPIVLPIAKPEIETPAKPVQIAKVEKPIDKAAGLVPLNSLSTTSYKNQTPKSMHLPDGSEVTIHYWRDILVECAKFVLKVNADIPLPLADKSGKKVTLLNTVKPSAGIGFTETVYNGKAIYIYINYDAENCIRNARYILGYLPKGHSWQAVDVKI